MFGTDKTIAAQDPSYPVYVDTTVMMGNTGLHNGKGFDGIEYMVCTPQNNFFPDLANVSAAVIAGMAGCLPLCRPGGRTSVVQGGAHNMQRCAVTLL